MDSPTVREEMEAAISSVLARHGEYGTKWLVLAETTGEDGNRGLWTLAPAEMKAYEIIGFCEYILQREQAMRFFELMPDS